MNAIKSWAGILVMSMMVAGAGCRPAGGAGSSTPPAAQSGGSGGNNDPGVPPEPGFASGVVIASVAEQTANSLSIFSVNEATGTIGQLAGSPANVGAPEGAEASVA